jgi:hypothetical protein
VAGLKSRRHRHAIFGNYQQVGERKALALTLDRRSSLAPNLFGTPAWRPPRRSPGFEPGIRNSYYSSHNPRIYWLGASAATREFTSSASQALALKTARYRGKD